ncbi:MAG: phosphatidylinositol N-acetylglucosaminyltransferase subunit gpi1 [Caeruleum heppii]|nr:MAG: phosphatidylinositol N-acetylglucosaminyltransferase subunit gpi1 [Caeruleum heppii]
MHPFSILTLAIFVAGYITARWDLVTRLYELATFAWDHGVVTRAAKGFVILSGFFFLFILPFERAAARETALLKNVENALRVGSLYRNAPYSIPRMFQLCGRAALHVLGLCNPDTPPSQPSSACFYAFTTVSTQLPTIYCAPATERSVQVVLFDRPHPTSMQYMSLDPISLALGDKSDRLERSIHALEIVDHEEEEELQRKLRLVEKLNLHTVHKHVPSPKESSLPTLINQVNCSFEMGKLLLQNVGMVGPRPKRSLSVGERVVESASTLWDYVFLSLWQLATVWLLPILRDVFIVGLTCHRVAAEMVLRILEWRLRPNYAALKDVSATAQQVDIRLQQFSYWPIQYLTLRKRKDDWQSVTDSHPDYIRFYNSLWLVANDVIMGIALGAYIMDNADWVAYQINAVLSAYTVEGLQRMITWLMDWPAGLKLNNELAAFLGDLFLWVIDYWAGSVAAIRPLLPKVIYFIGCSSFAGASMPISLFSDLLSLLTLHIYSFYIASARIYSWQLSIIISLFHLFRGKKRNVLRNRIDSCDYDLDQLLLGTILFTLLFFLLPTVVVFYLTFASARMVIISLKAALDTLLACLNHFPLHALMLRVKDSRRLPGGIRFALHDCTSRDPLPSAYGPRPPTSYIQLHSVPLSFRAMFQQYFQLGHRIRKHYLSPQVIFCLATGRFVPPIHRKNLYSLQYSMLPARRAGILETWSRLTGTAVATASSARKTPSTANPRRGHA